MNATVASERKSFLPLRIRSATVVGSSNIPFASSPTPSVPTSMPLSIHNDLRSSFTLGNRVLVNGLKIGTVCYVGTVQFAKGLFCGVELDEPEGKHDGQVNDVRYFQCKSNHGVFVPHDKIVSAPRERAMSTHQSISRLKPPAITRSTTLFSPVNTKIESNPTTKTSPTHVQLPDIIPNPSIPTQPITIVKTPEDLVIPVDYELITPTEEPKLSMKPILQHQSLPIDEPPETIEADFTDSVSLILHQLQQEQKPFLIESQDSVAISEESIADEEDDDTDDLDTESIAESSISEHIPTLHHLLSASVQTDVSFRINDDMFTMKNNRLSIESLSHSNRSLANSNSSINKLKVNTTDNKRKASIPTPIPFGKKDSERNTSTTPIYTASNAARRLSLIPAKKGFSSVLKQTPAKIIIPSGSYSKPNQSLSPSKTTSKSVSNTPRTPSHSIDLSSDKRSNSSRRSLDTSDHQMMIQRAAIRSLEDTNEHLKQQYQHCLNRFDVMCILTEYYLTENEQIKQYYESKPQLVTNQLQIVIEQMQQSHKNELITIDEEHRNQIDTIKELHKQELIEYQQQIDKLLNDKTDLESHCTSLQEQVNRFNEEMAASEHADPLLRRVEILEKDNTSLQTVLEIKNQELTQIRTKINEQVFQREDQLALQKRIDMAENRNQDLVCLLRNWQLNEKAIVVERDQLKEQIAQLERDNDQLTFANETLLYRLHQQPLSMSFTSKLDCNSRSSSKIRDRSQSLSSIMTKSYDTRSLHRRSVSLNYV